MNVALIQRRTVALLCGTQVIGGMGVAIGLSVGALLAARLAGTGLSGVAQSAAVVGGALMAVPATRVMTVWGRRAGLALAYAAGGLGSVLIVVAAATTWVPLLFLGMMLFGGGTTGNLQARYAAVDLAAPERRAREMSLVVWATTIGAVAAPNFASLADDATSGFGLPVLTGPFAFSAAAFVLAAVILLVFLRPDPLLTARRLSSQGTAPRRAFRPALRAIAGLPAARLGMAAAAVGHMVMVGVMSMTPVHLGTYHGDADVLRVVGIVLSLHIAGMYALSPLVGLLTDRLGRRPVILGGVGLLLAACALAGTAEHDTVRLSAGLFVLGLGWSCTMVAGSTLLSESVPAEVRPAAQGLSDMVMGLAGASAGALAGFLVELSGYATLNLLAAIATVPLVALALRPVAVLKGTEGAAD
ncbi:MFS transporter [Phytohabitans aurantiacus]|uniref:Tetracycline resistance protein n=1 Tax=Phytohabitans aurantiacus TaxID=3016789 RepID=A0ABQ5R0Z8_9ACTN|nr:MFS transporter [Phytohabitans aurantiacus]GLI00482.1 tetracycline resistance protein [Phytohabitans aurantiacus]